MARGQRSESQGELEMNEQTMEEQYDKEKSLERKAANAERSAKQILDAMPKKALEIPIDPLNPSDKLAIVGINGVIYAIPRGVEVEVPLAVYEVWKDSDRRTKEVNRRIEESTTKEVRVM